MRLSHYYDRLRGRQVRGWGQKLEAAQRDAGGDADALRAAEEAIGLRPEMALTRAQFEGTLPPPADAVEAARRFRKVRGAGCVGGDEGLALAAHPPTTVSPALSSDPPAHAPPTPTLPSLQIDGLDSKGRGATAHGAGQDWLILPVYDSVEPGPDGQVPPPTWHFRCLVAAHRTELRARLESAARLRGLMDRIKELLRIPEYAQGVLPDGRFAGDVRAIRRAQAAVKAAADARKQARAEAAAAEAGGKPRAPAPTRFRRGGMDEDLDEDDLEVLRQGDGGASPARGRPRRAAATAASEVVALLLHHEDSAARLDAAVEDDDEVVVGGDGGGGDALAQPAPPRAARGGGKRKRRGANGSDDDEDYADDGGGDDDEEEEDGAAAAAAAMGRGRASGGGRRRSGGGAGGRKRRSGGSAAPF